MVIGGGDSNNTALANLEIFNSNTNSFSEINSMKESRLKHRAIKLISGKVLITGGRSAWIFSSAVQNSVELFDPTNNSIFQMGSLKQSRAYHTSIELSDGRVKVIGGEGSQDNQIAETEIFIP